MARKSDEPKPTSKPFTERHLKFLNNAHSAVRSHMAATTDLPTFLETAGGLSLGERRRRRDRHDRHRTGNHDDAADLRDHPAPGRVWRHPPCRMGHLWRRAPLRDERRQRRELVKRFGGFG